VAVAAVVDIQVAALVAVVMVVDQVAEVLAAHVVHLAARPLV
jgi:hypothetical protein